MAENQSRILEVSTALARALTPADLDETLRNITGAAVAVLPQVDHASITVRHADGRLDSRAVTDDVLLDLDAKQYEWQEGPCYEGATDRPHVISSDLAHDERYPRYGPAAVAVGIHSQAGLRLYENPRGVGALNLYSRTVGALDDLSELAGLFAHQAAVAIAYAGEVQDLNEAIRSRTTIGQAVGIVMERYGLTDDRAFAFLTRLSSQRNVKLRLIAQEIVAAAEHRGEEEEQEDQPSD